MVKVRGIAENIKPPVKSGLGPHAGSYKEYVLVLRRILSPVKSGLGPHAGSYKRIRTGTGNTEPNGKGQRHSPENIKPCKVRFGTPRRILQRVRTGTGNTVT
ncbi:hypothetical protein TNCV_3123511 [Trichonephila clavipes]|nr:hypothetical protein TNCV_3123511 [Trichonephila clavipes]